MKHFNMTENWEDFVYRLRDRFPKLTSEDVNCIEGKEEETLERIANRLKRSAGSIKELFDRMRIET